jgi:hypothetical protein
MGESLRRSAINFGLWFSDDPTRPPWMDKAHKVNSSPKGRDGFLQDSPWRQAKKGTVADPALATNMTVVTACQPASNPCPPLCVWQASLSAQGVLSFPRGMLPIGRCSATRMSCPKQWFLDWAMMGRLEAYVAFVDEIDCATNSDNGKMQSPPGLVEALPLHRYPRVLVLQGSRKSGVKKVPVQARQPREKKERKKRKSKSISGRSIPWRRPPYGSCGRKKQKNSQKSTG